MSETTLPAVAKTIHLDCKKCGCERFFIVVAHTSATSAKVKCEVCGAQKTYKLPSEKKSTSGAAKKPRVSKSATAAKAGHAEEYEKMMSAAGGDAANYNMKTGFAAQQKLQHPKFGLGVVRLATPEKIEVLFQDEVRMLVHNRV